MVFKTRFYATAALVAVLGLAPFASASAQTSPSTTTTIFPPQNQAAGGGLLYFPQGGPGSLFAVPVLSDATLDAATQAEGTQLAAINATLQQINATLAALAKAQGTTVPVAVTSPPSSSGSSSSSSSSSSTSSGTYLQYPSTITCGGEGAFSFTGLSNATYTYTRENGGTTIAVYDAYTGALLNESFTGLLSGESPPNDCPSALP